MPIVVIGGLVLLAVNLIAVGLVLYVLHEFREGARVALQNVQVQLAFIAGRIGLSKQDLDRVVTEPLEPDLPTEVLGGTGWSEWEEEQIGAASEGSPAPSG